LNCHDCTDCYTGRRWRSFKVRYDERKHKRSEIIIKNQVTRSTSGVGCTHVVLWQTLLTSLILKIKDHFHGAESQIVINLLVSYSVYGHFFTYTFLLYFCGMSIALLRLHVSASVQPSSVIYLLAARVICNIFLAKIITVTSNCWLLLVLNFDNWQLHDPAVLNPLGNGCPV
jgi:hypothetical protein